MAITADQKPSSIDDRSPVYDINRSTIVLFIHGLGGDASGTWGRFAELIETDKSYGGSIKTAFYSFPTHLVHLPILRKKLIKIQHLAQGLATDIEHRYEKFERIILVCHSMGGLIAQKYFVDQVKKNTVPPITDILLYGTPNLGSKWAKILHRLPFLNNQVLQLQPDGDIAQEIIGDWEVLDCSGKTNARYIVGGQDAMVERNSASKIKVLGTHFIADKDHRALVKPKSHDDLSYLILRKAILTGYALKTPSALSRVDYKSHNSLSPHPRSAVLFEAYKPELEAYYIERGVDHVIKTYLGRKGLWVWGESGVGKTASIIRALCLAQEAYKIVALGHYVDLDVRGLMKGLYTELLDLTGSMVQSTETWANLTKSISNEIKILRMQGIRKILIEEIPPISNEEQRVFIEKLKLIMVDTSANYGEEAIHLVLSSILSPAEHFDPGGKTAELMTTLHFDTWTNVEAFRLIDRIVDCANFDLNLELRGVLLEKTQKSPRLIKMFFIDCLAAASARQEPADNIALKRLTSADAK